MATRVRTISTAITSRATTPSPGKLLGGRSVLPSNPRSVLDWVAVVRTGIQTRALDALSETLQISQSEIASALGIPLRTLARRRREGMLNSEESAKVVRLARALSRASLVFEDFTGALHWMKTANDSLNGEAPLSLMDTDIGAEVVLDTLGRIEHGVFA